MELSLSGGFVNLPTPGRHDGSCRHYRVNLSANSQVILPSAAHCGPGESVSIYNTSASHTVSAYDIAAGFVFGVLPKTLVEFFLIDAGAGFAGTWAVRDTSIVEGPILTMDRVPLEHTILEDVTDLNVRELFDSLGYDGAKPASVMLTLGRSGRNYIIGVNNADCALDSGTWLAGTTLSIFNYSLVTGRGGRGGRGGDVAPGLLATAGSDGNHGMRLRVKTSIANFGSIRGGGGGGGGGSASATESGSGGGGGAGHLLSEGGDQGSATTGSAGSRGVDGGAFSPGGGGNPGSAGAGGSGGAAGSAGQAGTGASGGAAGFSILRLSSVTVTKVVAGSIIGAEGTF
jgi:hypothetical protein